jgi:sensor domain CHASE-containing protein
VIVLAALISLMGFILYLIFTKRPSELDDEDFKKKFGSIFEGLKEYGTKT